MAKPAALRSSLSWLMADRLIRLLATAPVTLLIARSLGPEQFGRLGFALGVGGIAILIAQLGLDRILRRDLAETPENAGQLIGTSAVLTLMAAMFSVIAVTGYAQWGMDDLETRRVVMVLAWAGIPQALAPADLWFQSAGHPRLTVIAKTVVLVAMGLVRVVGCLQGWPVLVFAWLAMAEWIVGGGIVAWLMVREQDSPRGIAFSLSVAKRWIREAWPVFSMLLLGAFLERVEFFVLQRVSPPTETGYYSAAAKFSELWWSLSATTATAVVPWLSRVRRESQHRFAAAMQKYFDASMGITVLVAVVVTLLGPWGFPLLLGAKYVPAVPVLILLCWAGVGVYAEMARSQYLLIERKLHLDVSFNVVHIALTTLLCLWAVPRWGATGAAGVRCGGFFLVAFGLPWFVPSAREVARMQWRAFLFFLRPKQFWRLMQRLTQKTSSRNYTPAASAVTVAR